MSLTFQSARFLQGSVSVTDIVSTFTAANHIYGWLGGLEPARSVLNTINNPFSVKAKYLQLPERLQLSPVSGHLLTNHGPVPFALDNAAESFGGDVRTQIIGLTICALAHECGSDDAFSLFQHCLLHYLLQGETELLEAIETQLRDDTLRIRIINEGASRGLTQRFCSAIAALNLPFGDQAWLRQAMKTPNAIHTPSEIQYVGGLLRWITKRSEDVYYTRSALVARVAACLRAIGYGIVQIRSWNGSDPLPEFSGRGTVVLVLGGTSTTDPLMLDVDEFDLPNDQKSFIHHYETPSIGGLFLTALFHQSKQRPEVFQTYFEEAQRHIKASLTVSYTTPHSQMGRGLENYIRVRFDWASKRAHLTAIERRLAAIYFPTGAEQIAHCYAPIANAENLDLILKDFRADALTDDIPEALASFRTITAAIAFSVIMQLADKDFSKTRHSTNLYLGNDDWLVPICRIIDQSFSADIPLNNAIYLLSCIHTAQDPGHGVPDGSHNLIGWRKASYSVLPSLLMEMTPTAAGVGLHCLDSFVANIKVHGDGSIRDAEVPALLRWNLYETGNMHETLSALQTVGEPWTGPGQLCEPDKPLYLALESPRSYGQPDLCLSARVDGSLVGSVGILNILCVLIESLRDISQCRGCQEVRTVLNVKPSVWLRHPRMKPVGTSMATYVPAQQDPAWTLFLAGQAAMLGGQIVYSCLSCSTKSSTEGVLIGYS